MGRTPHTVEANGNRLTEGHLLRGLVGLALPMLASAALQNIQSLIDLFWVGRLGPDAVAGLAMSATVMMMIFPMVMGTATGTVALVSRSIGAGNKDGASHAAAQATVLAAVLGVVTAAVGLLAMRPLLDLLGASPEVGDLGAVYLRITLGCSATMTVLFVANSAIQGAGNTIIPMTTMMLANVINIVLDPVLIFGLLGFPRLGVRGAAIATVTAQFVAAVIAVAVLARGVAGLKVRRRHWRIDLPLQWRILHVGVPSTGQMLSRSLMGLVLMRIVAASGTAAVAAYGIVWRINMILLMPAFALGNSAATVVGQNLGASQPRRAAHGAWLAAGVDVALMAVSAAFLWFFAPAVVGLFTGDGEAIAVGSDFLRTVAPSFVFVALAIVLGRSMQGAGNTVPPMVITLITLWGLQVPLALLFSQTWSPATRGIWVAMATANVLHGLMAAGWFLTGRWKHQEV